MATEQLVLTPLGTKPTRIGLLGIALIAASIMAASFALGRSALEVAARADALAMGAENQAFCANLGFSSNTETHKKCMAGLRKIRLHLEQRIKDETIGLL